MQNHKLISLLLAVLLLFGVFTGCTKEESGNYTLLVPENEEVTYTEYEVTRGTFEKEIVSLGYMHFLSSAAIKLEESGAVLAEEITVGFGDLVEAGDVLAVFDLSYSESDLKLKRLEYDQAVSAYESQLTQYASQIEAKRAQIESLTGTDKAIAELELESLQLDLQLYDDKQSKQLENLRESLEEMESRTEPLVIRAPFSGLINSAPKRTSAGQEFSAGQVLFTMYEISPENVLLRCESMDYKSLIFGMQTRVFCTAIEGFETTGHVVASPHDLTDEEVPAGNDYAFVRIDDPKALQVFADFCIENNKSPTSIAFGTRGYAIRIEDTLLLQTKLLTMSDPNFEETSNGFTSTKAWVYILNDNGTPIRHEVLVGPRGGNMACILSGLNEGDIVVNVHD